MSIPAWADEQLSHMLGVLRAQGESQELEFKSEFPTKHVASLGKEVAAFASSNTGMILLGVSDDGELVGLPGCDDAGQRDDLLRRISGAFKGRIKPPITPKTLFAIEEGKVVLAIKVPKGSQPVYYFDNTPYIRFFTDSRPAEPDEVIQLVAAHLRQGYPDERQVFYLELTRILARILVIADEASERQINPWLASWRTQLGFEVSELRDRAVSSIAQEDHLESQLRELAECLDEVVHLQLTLFSNPLMERIQSCGELADKMLEQYSTNVTLSAEDLEYVRTLILTSAAKLEDLAARAEMMVQNGRIRELKGDASDLAEPLAVISRCNIDSLGDGIASDLKDVAHTLHLTETMDVYHDGGISANAVAERVKECAYELRQISDRLAK